MVVKKASEEAYFIAADYYRPVAKAFQLHAVAVAGVTDTETTFADAEAEIEPRYEPVVAVP